MEVIELKPGDKCPECGGLLAQAWVTSNIHPEGVEKAVCEKCGEDFIVGVGYVKKEENPCALCGGDIDGCKNCPTYKSERGIE